MKTSIFITIILFANTLISGAFVKYVPFEYSTIQKAIDNANDGDTIIIMDGVFHENIVIENKNITIGSRFIVTGDTSYISKTIINGEKKGSVVSFLKGDQLMTCLSGLTLTNGSGKEGYFSDHGYVYDTVYYGGGIYVGDTCRPKLEYLNIINNKADYGGGVYCKSGSPKITNVRISNNNASRDGGGLYSVGSKYGFTISLSKITNNVAIMGGGFLYSGDFDNRCLHLIDTEISNNTATYVGKYGHESGGAINCGNSRIIMENVTMVNNKGFNDFYMGNYYLEIHNSIIYKTKIFLYSEHDTVNSTIVDYSNIENGQNNFILNNAKLTWGIGNTTASPQFVNENYADYHLKSTSPCINMGNPDSIFYDSDGTRNDIGAYEFSFATNIFLQDIMNDVIIYPNPCSDYLYIKPGQEKIKSISIYSLTGEKLIYNDFNYIINMSSLKPNIYFLQIRTENTNRSYKIMKY